VDVIKEHLTTFMDTIEAEEIILFEKASFLDISHITRETNTTLLAKDGHRFERISNIIKLFKLSCMKSGTQLKALQVHNSKFNVFLDEFTSNTYIMVVVTDPLVYPAATLLNIKNARIHFDQLLQSV